MALARLTCALVTTWGLILSRAAEHVRVAFVIAGSPRSFIYPAVHESIRVNLISAFCPADTCSADVFVRVSLADNTHETRYGAVKDSKGIRIPGNMSDKPLIRHALSRLIVDQAKNGSGYMDVVWMDVGSKAEKLLMESHFPSFRHKVYQTLDPRRYSMYFGRWAAYQQAKNYARENKFRYSWFVHTRFDMAFGKPIEPHSYWPSNKIWVHDMWAIHMPDVFALLPARFADPYFSIDLLVKDDAMCLGGPNFDPQHVTISYLDHIGFSVYEIGKINNLRCPNPDRGVSEEILMRKLSQAGVSWSHGTVGMAPIFSVVIRLSFKAYCVYLRPDHMFPFLRASQISNTALYTGCVGMTQQFRELHLNNRYLDCDPMPLMSKAPYTRDCMLNPRVSEFNYMPYRIRLPRRIGGDCLTVNGNVELKMKPCIAHEHVAFIPSQTYEVNASFSISQLFRVYPYSKRKQPIVFNNYSKLGNAYYCLAGANAGSQGRMSACAEGLGDDKQLMRIRVLRQGHGKSVPNPKARILYNGLCLAYGMNRHSYYLSWQKCPTKLDAKNSGRPLGFEFFLEKTN